MGDQVYRVAVHLGQFVYEIDCVGEDCTCGWLLSEVMRRYMDSNDGADPGLLGLKILQDDRDLDLGADVVDAVHVGETIVGVSYTIKPKKEAEVDKKAALTLRSVAAKEAGLQMEGELELEHDDDGEGGMSSLNAGIPTLTGGTRNTLFNPSEGTHARKLFGVDVCVPFTPLASLQKQIDTIDSHGKQQTDRARVLDRSTVRYAMKTVKDPTSALPLITVLVLGPTRLGIVEPEETEYVFDFLYEDIIGWGDTGKWFFIELEMAIDDGYEDDAAAAADAAPPTKKLARFEFEIGSGKTAQDVLQILYTRCARIANQRRVQKKAQAKLDALAPSIGECFLCTVTYYANRAHNLTRSP
jgi:hypothetical protein